MSLACVGRQTLFDGWYKTASVKELQAYWNALPVRNQWQTTLGRAGFAGRRCHFVECQFGHTEHICLASNDDGTKWMHLGSHPYSLRCLLEVMPWETAKVLVRAWWEIENSDSLDPVIVFVCKWGKHRSVGCSTLTCAMLRAMGYNVADPLLGSLQFFGGGSCGVRPCRECDVTWQRPYWGLRAIDLFVATILESRFFGS